MSDLLATIDRMSWGSVGLLVILAALLMLGLLVALDAMRNSRARYWGGR